MSPPSAIKYLYAAFAENPSCGPPSYYYEEAMQCGGSPSNAAASNTGNENGRIIEKNRTFDGSLEVGIRRDSEVFKPHDAVSKQDVQLPSSSRKEENDGRGTPDTSLNSSPESSIVDLNESQDDLSQAKAVNLFKGSEYLSFAQPSKPKVPKTSKGIKLEENQMHVFEDVKPMQKKETISLATTTMFTDEDLDAITPRQIKSYLTKNERKKISTNVLSSKGYTLVTESKYGSCLVCNMPKFYSSSGELVDTCVICPALKKHVLEKILEGASPLTIPSDSCFADACLQDIADDLSPFEQDLLVAAPTAAMPRGSSTDTKDDVIFENHASQSRRDNRDFSPTNDNFILNTKKSAIDGVVSAKSYYDSLKSSFLCNFDEFEVPEGKDSVEYAREMLATKVDVLSENMPSECNPDIDMEYHKESVAVAGEMFASKVASVRQSKVAVGLEFEEVRHATQHAARVLTANNVSCIPGALKSGGLPTGDVEGNAVKNVHVHGAAELHSVGTKAELKASAETALIDQDDQDETIIVETASEDANE